MEQKMMRAYRKLHSEKLHNVYSLPLTHSRKWWEGHV